MEILGVQFAPINIPFQRRLQTLAAGAWFFTMAFGGFVGIILALYLVFFTRFWWLTLMYLLWAWVIDKDTEEQGGRSVEWVRQLAWWRYLRDYFPVKLERAPWVELDPKRNYLFCAFPHGMLPVGVFTAFGTNVGEGKEYFPHHNPHVVTLSQHYTMPFFRELALSLGGIGASAKSIDYVLSRPEGGHIVVLLVGGAVEAYYCRPGQYTLVLKRRKGFVKLALKNGTPLVPVISFGETDLFSQIDNPEGSWFRRFQETLRNLIGLAPIIPLGRGFFQYNFGIVPQRKPVTTVVGQPIEVEKVEYPTREQVEELHAKFMVSLQNLFEEQKHRYVKDPESTKLIIE